MPETKGTNQTEASVTPLMYSDKTLAAALGISKDLVFRARMAGQLKAYKIGGCVRILPDDARKWFTSEPWEPRQSA